MSDVRVSSGLDGLDVILDGGFLEGKNVLLRGSPGSGKTIVGLHFLAAGIEADETSLFVNLGEPAEYVTSTAEAFGLGVDDIEFHHLSPTGEQFAEEESYTLFESAEVERPGFVTDLRETIEAVEPDRVLLDPITEFRYLTVDDRQFRTQILALLDYLKRVDATVVLTSQAAESITDDDLQFLVDAVVTLDVEPTYRQLTVSKFRGSSYRRGSHFYTIRDDGVEVWPRLVPGEVSRARQPETLSSGVSELDQLLGGGLDVGTVTFLSGPTGVGKTTTGIQLLSEATRADNRAVLFQFEESQHTLQKRAASVNIPLEESLESGDLSLVELLPDEYTIGEFEQMVRTAIVDDEVDVVMLDGIQGFKQNLRGLDNPEKALLRIGRFLRASGVLTLFINEVHTITGQFRATEEGVSNLADNIIFLRHVEYRGEMRKVIGVLKMRTSDFERNLRELEITETGLRVGEPLPHLRGILTGTPDWKEASDVHENS